MIQQDKKHRLPRTRPSRQTNMFQQGTVCTMQLIPRCKTLPNKELTMCCPVHTMIQQGKPDTPVLMLQTRWPKTFRPHRGCKRLQYPGCMYPPRMQHFANCHPRMQCLLGKEQPARYCFPMHKHSQAHKHQCTLDSNCQACYRISPRGN